VGEAMVAIVVADAMLEKFGGDSLTELLAHLETTRLLFALDDAEPGSTDSGPGGGDPEPA